MKKYFIIALYVASFFLILPIVIIVAVAIFEDLVRWNGTIGIIIFLFGPVVFTISYLFIGRQLLFTREYFRRLDNLIIFAILITGSCQFVGLAAWRYIYMTKPFPYPAPFPDVKVEETWRDVGHGWYGTIVFEYEAELSLVEMENYYNLEMAKYCADDWQFVQTDDSCRNFTKCRTAECEIPRPFVEDAQYFLVYLRSVSETRTNVLYVQKTINP